MIQTLLIIPSSRNVLAETNDDEDVPLHASFVLQGSGTLRPPGRRAPYPPRIWCTKYGEHQMDQNEAFSHFQEIFEEDEQDPDSNERFRPFRTFAAEATGSGSRPVRKLAFCGR